MFYIGAFFNSLLSLPLRGEIDVNSAGGGNATQTAAFKSRNAKEVFPLMKEVDCPYQAARWPMECQVRTTYKLYEFSLWYRTLINRQMSSTFAARNKM